MAGAGSVAAGGGQGVGVSFAGAGAGSGNSIKNTIDATIKDSSQIKTENGNLILSAIDDSSIVADAAGVSVSVNAGQKTGVSVAVGIAVAINSIENATTASVVNSNVPDVENVTLLAHEASDIDAFALAATVSIAAAKNTAISISGGGAASKNDIDNDTNAFIQNSQIGTASNKAKAVSLTSTDKATIHADIIAAAVGAASIGVAIAINEIGATTDRNEVQAYISNSDVLASGALSLSAHSDQTIEALVVVGSVAVAAASQGSAFSFSGSGVYTQNTVATQVKATVLGDGTAGLEASNISLVALDESSITADAGAVAVAVSVASKTAVAISVGLSLAHNTISNVIEAGLSNADNLIYTNGGDILVRATDSSDIQALTVAAAVSVSVAGSGVGVSGGGAEATNVILTKTNAFIADSTIGTDAFPVGAVDLDAKSQATINAIVAAASVSVGVGSSSAGVGVALGVAVARNFIGWDPYAAIVDGLIIDADATPRPGLSKGTKVRIREGALVGEIYEYIGPTTLDSDPNTDGIQLFDLRAQQYLDSSIWKHANVGQQSNDVQAYIRQSSIDASRSLTIDANAAQSINSIVAAAAVGVGVGSSVGVGVSAAGAYSENKISTNVRSYIDGDGAQTATDGISASSVALGAFDSSTINAIAGAASISGAFGSTAGVSVGVGLSLAFNEISNDVDASVRNADQGVFTTSGDFTAKASSTSAPLFSIPFSSSLTASKLNDAAKADLDDSDTSGTDEGTVDLKDDVAILESLRAAFAAKGTSLAVFDTVATAAMYSTDDGIPQDLRTGTSVSIASNIPSNRGDQGRVYQYIGSEQNRKNVNLANENYKDQNNWVRLDKLKITQLVESQSWILTAPNGTSFLMAVKNGELQVTRNSINAVSAAASISAGFGSTAGVSVAGAGAVAENVILSRVNAYGADSIIDSKGSVELEAFSDSTISSIVAAASIAVGGGSTAGVGASIGISIARNLIGWTPLGIEETPAQIRAYLQDSSVRADGDLVQNALSNQSIQSIVVAGSVAVGAGGTVGVGVAGSGAISENKIGVDVKSYIDRTLGSGILADRVTLTARDQSKIDAITAAASLSVALGGTAGVAVSVGVSAARNLISSDVAAYVKDAANKVQSTVGNIEILADSQSRIQSVSAAASIAAGFGGTAGVAVAGAGALSTNVILTNTEAYLDDSTLQSAGLLKVEAENTASIQSLVVAASGSIAIGGTVGVGASIGAATASNLIGKDELGFQAGSTVQAYSKNASILGATGLTIQAFNDQKIKSLVVAGSVAIAGGTVGVGVAGAGAVSSNDISVDVLAYIDGDGAQGISVGSLTVKADDDSYIKAETGAASVAASFGVAGASVAVGLASAINSINNTIDAAIRRADQVTTTSGAVMVLATERAMIESTTASAAAAASVSIGGSAAGALTTSKNILNTHTNASIVSSIVNAATGVTVEAMDTSNVSAEVVSVALSAGLVSLAVGVALVDNTIGNNVSAFIQQSDVTALGSGDITVNASSTPTISSTSTVGAGSFGFGGSGAGGSSNTTINGTTQAYVNGGTLTATGDDIIVRAQATSTANPKIQGLSVGLAAVSRMTSNATIAGKTRAWAGGAITLAANGLDVTATDHTSASPVTIVNGGGVFAISITEALIDISRTTEAAVVSGADINIGGGHLSLLADSTTSGVGSAETASVSAIDIGLTTIDTRLKNTTRAAIEPLATVRANGGGVSVSALADNRGDASIKSLGIGLLLKVGSSKPTAEVSATTEALAQGSIVGSAPGQSVGNVTVLAQANDRSTAGSAASGGGLISVSSSSVNATTRSTVNAGGGGVIDSGGSISIQAFSRSDADASSKSSSGGAVDVTNLKANASASPTVNAFIDAVAVITARQGIAIAATHGEDPPVYSDGSFDAVTGVDPAANTIAFTAAHGLLTGDTVSYNQNGQATKVNGLADGRTYGVIVGNGTTLQLGATFNSLASNGTTPSIDLPRDTITFAGAHNLQDGDHVVYTTEGASAVIGGLTSGNTYVVKRVDANTIKLADVAGYPAAKPFSGAAISGNTIALAGHGFSAGQAVTYRAPTAATFGAPGVSDANDTINLGVGHGLVSGDELIYTTDGVAIGGLTPGQRYFAIVANPATGLIQLARTYAEAVGVPANPGNPNANPVVPPTQAVPITPIALTPSTLPAARDDLHSLRKVANQPIGGLLDGVTYYVDRINADSLRLLSTPGGSVVTLGATDVVSGAVLGGTSTLGKESVDLTNVGSGSHRLVIDITADGSGTQILEGVGGARALAGAPPGDGVVTSAASGSGGGIVRVSSADVSASTTPNVVVTIGSGAHLTAADITVSGLAKGNASASSANSGGGLVSVGDAKATLGSDASSAISIGSNALLRASNDITISSLTNQTSSVLAQSNGGGLVDFARARTTANLNYSSTLIVAAGADIKAQDQLTLDAGSVLKVNATSTADSGGLGSDAESAAVVNIGLSDSERVLTQVDIAGRLQGADVKVRARVTDLDASAKGEGFSSGLVTDADAQSRVRLFDDVLLKLSTGAAITGDTVNLTASHAGIDVRSRSNADTSGLYGDADSNAETDYDSKNRVVVASGATVSSRDLFVTSTQSIDVYDRSRRADVDVFGDTGGSEQGDFDARREIDWNGNVTFLAQPTPVLLVDANGLVVRADNVTVNGGLGAGTTVAGGTITVDAISNRDNGQAGFTVGNVADRDGKTAPVGALKGAGGTFSSGSNFSSVSIDNQSNKTLMVGDISLANSTAVPNVSLSAASVTLQFDVGNLAPPGDVLISVLNRGSGDIRIGGVIDNPIGRIVIENRGGSIVANDGNNGVLRGNNVVLKAAGAIGDSTRRLDVDLVRSAGRNTDLAATATTGDVRLNLTGRLRDPSAALSNFGGSDISAGGNVDLQLQTTRQETASSGFASDLSVSTNAAPAVVYREHYSVDTNNGPRPLDYRVFADVSKGTDIATSYAFGLVSGKNISIVAARSAATDPRIDFSARTDHGNGFQIDALINGNLTLTETVGDVLLQSVQSTAGDVNVTVAAGGARAVFVKARESILLDARGGEVDAVSMQATRGHISIDARQGAAKLQFVQADGADTDGGSITVHAGRGDINVIFVKAAAGDVTLTADGTAAAIYETGAADNSATPFVIGNSITLNATAGIGSAGDFFEIDSSFQATGLVRAIANTSIFLTETAGAMNLDGVSSNHADVSLLTLSGSILDGKVEGSGDLADIQGRSIDLIVRGGGIGISGNDVEIHGAGRFKQNNALEITTGQPADGRLYVLSDQGVYLKEVNATLDVMRVEALAGDVRLSVYDSLETILGTSTPLPQDLRILPGNGSTLAGTAVTGGLIQALNGSVLIDAGDDVQVPVGTLVKAGTAITVRGDYAGMAGDERDLNIGTTITIEGDLQALKVEIDGGADIDYLQLLGTAGINAGGTTWLVGNSSDDRFFVQGTQNSLTLQGNSGADRYYLGSAAAKQIFMGGGFFNDDLVNVFDLFLGTLDTIQAMVTVETGTGGGGGTRDIVYASSGSSTAAVSGSITDNAGIASLNGLGIGMSGSIDVSIPDASTGFFLVGLGQAGDSFQVKGLGPKFVAEVFGQGGDDTLNVYNDSNSLAGISGIVAFHGGAGSDTLEVRGDATAPVDPATAIDPDQLSAISVTGLGMGKNTLFSTHDRFGAGYDSNLGNQYPGAVYYATRTLNNGASSFASDVELVNVRLGGGADTFRVDSVYDKGQTSVFGGGGDDTLTVGSTATGLQPQYVGQLDFVYGALRLDGEGGSNTFVADDSQDAFDNTGRYEGHTLYGLGMPLGSIAFENAAKVDIRLGFGKDSFYVPAIDASVAMTLSTGPESDTVYVGTVAGREDRGSLAGIQGSFSIEGQGNGFGDRLFFNDQDSSTSQTYTVSNAITGSRSLANGNLWPVDTTTFARQGAANVLYRGIEIVALNAGSGSDSVNLHSTHREQEVAGGKSSSFTVNGGSGNDLVMLGAPNGSGLFSLNSFAIDLLTPTFDSTKGIAVIVNGQGGADSVQFLDNANNANANLGFAQRDFKTLHPASLPGDADGAADAYVALFQQIFDEDPQSQPFATVVLSRAAAATVTPVGTAGSGRYTVATDATGGSYELSISLAAGGQLDVSGIAYDITAAALKLRLDAAGATIGLVSEVTAGAMPGSWNVRFLDASLVSGLAIDGGALLRESPLNVNARLTEEVRVTLGGGNDLVQLTNDSYRNAVVVDGGGGNDVFNVENAVNLNGDRAVFNG